MFTRNQLGVLYGIASVACFAMMDASEVSGKLSIENRFVKKGEVILRLKSGEEIIADFEGKLGKREIAQGVLKKIDNETTC